MFVLEVQEHWIHSVSIRLTMQYCKPSSEVGLLVGAKNGVPLDLLCVPKQVAEKVDVLAECSPFGNAFRSLTQYSDNTTLGVCLSDRSEWWSYLFYNVGGMRTWPASYRTTLVALEVDLSIASGSAIWNLVSLFITIIVSTSNNFIIVRLPMQNSEQ